VAKLQLYPVMVTPEDVENLAEAVRAIGHVVSIGGPSYTRLHASQDEVLRWSAERLRNAELEQVIDATKE
jgi:hypothetical protein